MKKKISSEEAKKNFEAPGQSSFMKLLKNFLSNPMALFGLITILLFILLAIFADVLPLHPPTKMYAKKALQPPSWEFLLGTDSLGRDILSRLIYGIRVSFLVAGLSVTISTIVGTLIGVASGYFGGFVENIFMRLMDILFSFPAVLLGLVIVSILGSSSMNLMMAIAIVYTPIFARVALGATKVVKEKQFIDAAKASGCRDHKIIFSHIIPNIQAPITVQISLALSWALLTEAVFSFLGLGVQPPNPSWGLMLSEGKNFMEYAPWIAISPGIAIIFAVLGFNLLGDGLRDLLDPQIRDLEQRKSTTKE